MCGVEFFVFFLYNDNENGNYAAMQQSVASVEAKGVLPQPHGMKEMEKGKKNGVNESAYFRVDSRLGGVSAN